MAPSFPRPFGKYTLLQPLEEGAAGDVFLAHSDELGFNELCVIKRLGAASEAATESQLARTRRALPLAHDCLMAVVDIGEDEGQVFAALEYLEGRDLSHVLATCEEKGVALPVEAGLYIGIQLCKGLRVLHDQGRYEQLRRVIDPVNVHLSFDGDVKLGMARTRDPDRESGLQRPYTGLAYLSPEELADDPIGPLSDVFSLGMVLWDLLVGQPLHQGLSGRQQTLEAALAAAQLRPSSYNEDLNEELDALVMRALAPRPQDRHANVEELRADLASALVTREPSFDGAALADLLGQIYGEEAVTHARRESRRLLARAERVSLAAKAATVEVDSLGGVEAVERAVEAKVNAAKAALHSGDTSVATVDTDMDLRAVEHAPPLDPDAAAAAAESIASEDALAADNLAGQVIGSRYRVRRRIGEGGMGAVYLGEHIDIGRQVAIKVLHAAYSHDPELVKRFRQEARAAAEIGHPNIIEVTDFGVTGDGRIYFVMEYLDGEDLAQVMAKTRRLPIHRSLQITLQICEALHAAHEAGIVHRDLKPENVFLIEKDGKADFVKILDFGVAINIEMVRRGDARLTTPGMAMGTPEYMAPEQAAGRSIDRRIDVYATAVMLYEMVTGRLPHEGPTLMALLNKKATEEPTKPSRYRGEVDGAFEEALLRGLERDAKQRFQTMEELKAALEEALLHTTGPQALALSSGGLAVADAKGLDATQPATSALDADGRPRGPASGLHPLDEVITGSNGLPAGEGSIPATLAPGANPFDAAAYEETPTLQRPRSNLGIIILAAIVLCGAGAGLWWWLNARKASGDAPSGGAVEHGAGTAAVSKKPRKKPKKARKRRKPRKPNHKKKGSTKKAASKPRKLSAKDVRRALARAKRAAKRKRYTRPKSDNVRDHLRRVDRDYPKHSGVAAFRKSFCSSRYKKAKRYQRRRRTRSKAEKLLQVCLAIHPHYRKARSLLSSLELAAAKRQYRRRRYTSATRGAQAALKTNPRSAAARELLGDISYRRRRYKTALRYYKAALAQGGLSRRHKRSLARKLRKAKRRAR